MLALVDLFLRFPALVVFAEKIPAVFGYLINRVSKCMGGEAQQLKFG